MSQMLGLAEQVTVEVGGQLAETIASYDATARRYALQFGDVDMSAYLERFVDMLPPGRATVLDAGCGAGRDSRWLQGRGVNVLGVDLSSGLLAEARRVCGGRFVQGDLRDLPLAGQSVDGVWSCASLVHLPIAEVSEALSQFRAVLRPGGALFISVRYGQGSEWRSDGAGGRRYFHFHTPKAFSRELARSGFTLKSLAVERGVVAGQWLNAYASVAP